MPKKRKAFGVQHCIQGLPINRVKGFSKVQFQNHSLSFSLVTALNNFSSIQEVFCNTPPFEKPSLMNMH
uniref:Uncharacterized protein n=1 Tax=Arundo donax TaxID=35708 RepID=A0A0A8ZF19_ARUDO